MTQYPPSPTAAAARAGRLSLWLFGLLAVLGAADYALTAALVRPEHSPLGEGNVLAGWVLARGGWAALAAFKAASLALAGGLCLLIARRRPAVVPYVLGAACLATGGTVVYSLGLAQGYRQSLGPGGRDVGAIVRQDQQLQQGRARAGEYLRAVREAGRLLREGRASLAEAVAALDATEQAHDPAWHRSLRAMHPALEGRGELLAVTVVQHALAGVGDESVQDAMAGRLAREFRERYGRDLPELPILAGRKADPPMREARKPATAPEPAPADPVPMS